MGVLMIFLSRQGGLTQAEKQITQDAKEEPYT